MKASTSDNTRKWKRSAVKGILVGVRLQPRLLTKLDAWRQAQQPVPTRPEAIRSMVEATLKMLAPDE